MRDRTYMLLCDPDELRKATPSFNSLPLLIEHRVTSADDHPFGLVIGATGDSAEFRDPDLFNSLVIWASEAIRAIETGERRDISCGYRYTPLIAPGTWEGRRYDGVMTDIIAQHAALVPEGRVPAAVVADALPGQWQRQEWISR